MIQKQDYPKGVVLFDLDGTLVDSSGDIARSVNHIRQLLGMSRLSTKEVLGEIGQGNVFLLSRVTGIQENEPFFAKIVEQFKNFYLKHQTECSHPYPGIRQVLERLQQEHHLYVLSNKPHIAVVAELAGQGLEPFFREVWGAGALSQMKPDPIGILKAAEMSGVPTSRAVMVGDMRPDIEAATNGGAKSCFVTWGFGEFDETFPNPTAIVDRVSDLVPVVNKLVSGESPTR